MCWGHKDVVLSNQAVTVRVVVCGVVCEDRLSSNYFGVDGTAALAPALRGLTALQTLGYVCRV